MPQLDGSMAAHAILGTTYGFSAKRIDRLGAAEYTLATVAADVSGSVAPFMADIASCIGGVVQACRQAPRADNLMMRVTAFGTRLAEVHGFKPLLECAPGAYASALRTSGSTALYDAAHNAVSAATNYGRQLTASGFAVNAVVFVITDGCDNASTLRPEQVRRAVAEAVSSEALESVHTVLIGVNVQRLSIGAALADFAKAAAFDDYIELDRADARTLAGLADFVSQSIALRSVALSVS